MPTCPHSHENAVKFENQYDGESILICYSCNNTSFRCAKCKEANHLLSYFCRSCGQELSFNRISDYINLNLGTFEEKTSIIIPEKSGKILSLYSNYGYINIFTENRFYITNTRTILKQLDLIDETPRGCFTYKDKSSVPLLVTSDKRIYSIDLLNLDKKEKILFEVSESSSILHNSVFALDIYWVERNKHISTVKFCSLKKGEIKTYSDSVSPLLKIGKDKIFITTENELELYDCISGNFSKISLTDGNNTDVINLGGSPIYNERKNAVYLFGKNKLWRINLGGNELTAQSLQAQSTGNECLAVSKEGHILVSRHDGFYIFNSFGNIDWQADSTLVPESLHFDGRTPQVWGKYCIFSGLTANGNVIRVYNLDNPNKYSERLSLINYTSCEPLFSFGYLFIPSIKATDQVIKVYKLKEYG